MTKEHLWNHLRETVKESVATDDEHKKGLSQLVITKGFMQGWIKVYTIRSN